jgi:hypothetical protein
MPSLVDSNGLATSDARQHPMAMESKRASEVAENLIEIRVNDIAQLFHTLDPFPFREKDLADEAEDYIVSWAREMPSNHPFKIVVHIPDNEAQKGASRDLIEAFNRYFAGRSVVVQRDLNELFRIGRRSLVIGASILVTCFLLAHLAGSYLTETAFKRLAEESFLILGWVANWRPLEIFLYDWWPLAHRRDLYNRLSVATVELTPYPIEADTFSIKPTSIEPDCEV